MQSRLLVVILAILLIFVLAACSNRLPTSVGEFIDTNQGVKDHMVSKLSSLDNANMTTQIEYYNNTIVIRGTANATYSQELVKKMREGFDKSELANEDLFRNEIAEIEDASGLHGVSIIISINNADGTNIWEKEYI